MQTSGADLGGAAVVSDQIRQIHIRSLEMHLHAMNAIVATRSRGIDVPGFATVASQMQVFSRDLEHCLSQLRDAVVRWVGVISQQVARDRRRAVFAAAAAASDASARAIARLAHVPDPTLASRTQVQRELVSLLDNARQLAVTGCVLARAAKLEAVHGGALAAWLISAAEGFKVLADAVDESVRAIAKRVDRWR
jgi:hypothetical protein